MENGEGIRGRFHVSRLLGSVLVGQALYVVTTACPMSVPDYSLCERALCSVCASVTC